MEFVRFTEKDQLTKLMDTKYVEAAKIRSVLQGAHDLILVGTWIQGDLLRTKEGKFTINLRRNAAQYSIVGAIEYAVFEGGQGPFAAHEAVRALGRTRNIPALTPGQLQVLNDRPDMTRELVLDWFKETLRNVDVYIDRMETR